MVAVVAVIADHLIAWPSGGFVGVDVFFVLSGFLITGILLREHRATGTISFRGFYARRIRRILPASLLVLVVTVVASVVLFAPVRALATALDGVWAALFAANWRFVALGTDYLQVGLPASPLRHYWSLAVEEQFYFVWPWLLLGVLVFAGRLAHERARFGLVVAVLGAVTAASFAWSLVESSANPPAAYFSTFSRAWELGVGSLLAVLAPRLPDWRPGVRIAAAWVGLVGVLSSVVVVTASWIFPGPGALLPVLSTGLLVLAGAGATTPGYDRALLPLTNPVSRYLGDISFSLYLWHFPVVVLLPILLPEGGRRVAVLAVALTLALSVASYHLVENPVRRASRSRRPIVATRRRLPRRTVAAVTVVALVLGATLAAAAPRLLVGWAPAAASGTATSADFASEADLRDQIAVALDADDWPRLEPAIGELGRSAWAPEWTRDNCLDVTAAKAARCRYGDADAARTIAVVGDSMAVSWMPGLRRAAESAGYAVQVLTLGQCPAAYVDVVGGGKGPEFAQQCREHNDWVVDEISRTRPAVVVATTATNTLDRLVDQPGADAALAELGEGMRAMTADLASAGSEVVLLAPLPRGRDLGTCWSAVASPADCVSRPTDQYRDYTATLATLADELPRTRFVPTVGWVCDGMRCPSFVGTTAVLADADHPTWAFSRRLAPLLARAVLGDAT